HHSGVTLADYYALQAGVPEACGLAPELGLGEQVVDGWQQRLQQLGIARPYAVVHTKAGWDEKSPPAATCERIVAALADANVTPVVIGGPGERVDHPSACNLAGELSMAESAAAIAAAELFVGPDSGPLHIASAFGVRSLAMFGGSHLRVAPPRAVGSCSVQAASCCPVPCGVTPCPERNCGAKGLIVDVVLPRLQQVLTGEVHEHAEYWGQQPAHCVRSADGPSLAAQPFGTGQPADPVFAPRSRTQPGHRAAAAPTQPLPVELGLYALKGHAAAIEAPLRPAGTCRDTAQVLEAIRDGVAPELGLDVLRALIEQCRSVGDPAAAVQMVAAAIAHCGAIVRGARGRARAAFRLHADQLLHQGLFLPGGPALREQLLALYEAEVGVPPGLEHVLNAIALVDERTLDDASCETLRGRLRASLGDEPMPHAQALRVAGMLRRVRDTAAAIAVLDAQLATLPRSALGKAAEARFLRGTFLVAEGQPQAAIDDMRFAAAHLAGEQDRRTAIDIADRIEGHLGNSLMAR
ncbi:MAG: hypothetical protein KAI24_20400, partial [Planctomycetes bacterium]|nr:hypothetical protein [Planctomycetota bacterium]